MPTLRLRALAATSALVPRDPLDGLHDAERHDCLGGGVTSFRPLSSQEILLVAEKIASVDGQINALFDDNRLTAGGLKADVWQPLINARNELRDAGRGLERHLGAAVLKERQR